MPTRGSELLKTRAMAARDLSRLVALTKAQGIKVVDWHILGQPVPDAVTGTLQVGARAAPRVIASLLKLGYLRPRLEVFPLGIPVPHQFNVRFRV